MTVTSGLGLLLGLIPVNVPHDIVHILFGMCGLLARGSYGAARGYARAVAIVYALLTVTGLVPAMHTTFGLVPLYGHDVGLHALLAAVAACFGFVQRDTAATATARV